MDDRYSHNEGGGVEDHYFGILFFFIEGYSIDLGRANMVRKHLTVNWQHESVWTFNAQLQ